MKRKKTKSLEELRANQEVLKVDFAQARAYVHSLALNRDQWRLWTKGQLPEKGIRPDFVPRNPDVRFRSAGWVSWTDWFGLRTFLPFEEARAFARSLNLTKSSQWELYCAGKLRCSVEKPSNIPSSPNKAYKDEFTNYKDWLGIPDFLPFEEAREYVRALKLGGQVKWKEYIRKGGNCPLFIPHDPAIFYKDKWQGFGDWTGSGRIRKFNGKSGWVSFEEAREFVRTLGLQTLREWNDYINGNLVDKPTLVMSIPKSPGFVYKDEFKGMQDWLGAEKGKKRNGMAFNYKNSLEFVHSLKLTSIKGWNEYARGKREDLPEIPLYVPKNPIRSFHKEWGSWEEWLGCELVRNNRRIGRKRSGWMPFYEAKAFVHTLSLKRREDWVAWLKDNTLPDGIPRSPRAYKDDWLGWNDWLGSNNEIRNGRRCSEFLPFEEAREFARTLGLNIQKEWWAYNRTGERPNNIPSDPRKQYKDGWKGWNDWLGENSMVYRDTISKIIKLKNYLHSLDDQNIKEINSEISKIVVRLGF